MSHDRDTLDKIGERLTQLTSRVLALQDILLKKQVMTPEEYSEAADYHYKLQSNDPTELLWRDSLQARPGGGKR